MSPEPSLNKSSIHGTSERATAEASQVILPKTFETSSVMDGDGEDIAFAKAPTLMIDLEETPSSEGAESFGVPPEMPLKHYIQGVIQGQQSYLITNLLGESLTLFQPQMVWTIGRNRGAALPLRDRLLSRRHAVIMFVLQEGFHLVDLNSMNGSYLNGTRLQQRQLLKDGDRIRLGTVEFNFFISQISRTIEPIHPEVLARFTSSKSCQEGFMEYSALEEPEILFTDLPT
ncbi:FHA domain-containing protein [Phormidium sp. CLA17]|uniref:FHA domain-containing protein n=1 Tax=Leptolyngbya sp. Cla-17 TaxID=2803751 RepID=UPI0014911549|nr:FHA domain-containing protein [Leptolyngbya sp. Cla-17]MBM0742812.1 FHA domain-containing protein [Leptolyngbya sp. Cla-17]